LGKVTQLFTTQTAVKRFTAQNRKTQKMQTVTAKPVNRKVGQQPQDSGQSIGATVNITASSFDKRRKNKTGEQEYAAKHGTDIDANEMTTKLIRREHLKSITSHVAKTRVGIRHYSSPWDDGGNRRVAPLMVPTMQNYITKRRMEWEELVGKFADSWADIRKDSEQRLKGDFAKYAHLFPAVDDRSGVLERFALTIVFGPLGGAENLPVDLREMWEEEDERRREEISQDLRDRLYDKLNHLAARCTVAGDDGTRFAKSNLGHVLELCEILPSMMLDGDADLMSAIGEAKFLLGSVDADCITSSKIVANDIGSKAKEIANSLM
jgi:hypothetical protein